MREWLKEFRDFALRGNVMDLAIAFVIGAAFTAIVKSFVGDLIMPLRWACCSAMRISAITSLLCPVAVTPRLRRPRLPMP